MTAIKFLTSAIWRSTSLSSLSPSLALNIPHLIVKNHFPVLRRWLLLKAQDGEERNCAYTKILKAVLREFIKQKVNEYFELICRIF